MQTGYTAIVETLGLAVPAPYTVSHIAGSVRRSEIRADHTVETFPKKHAHAGGFRDHLLFALKHEPADFRVLAAAFKKLGPEPVLAWLCDEPTGGYARRAWFLYEFLTGDRLDRPNARTGSYVDVLDPKRHIVGDRRVSTRHRVWDNLLGVPGFCPAIRRTAKLESRIAEQLDREAVLLTENADPAQLRRAVKFLYTKETRSTFEIEGEAPNPRREERFIAALGRAAQFDPTDKPSLIALQNTIVEPRYAAADWRTTQNFVGETVRGYREVVHLICPKPADVPGLMTAWKDAGDRLLRTELDPVLIAALLSFGFVFIHPFEDGNGRVQRFLIHSVLARKGFSPRDVILPVSIAIVRDMPSYDAALETFSKPLLSLIDWRLTEASQLIVEGETADHYRYFDATPLAEYLYDRVAETVRTDLPQELEFLGAFDRAYVAVRNIIDIPNQRLSLFVRLVMSNGGQLSKAKRKLFPELSEDEIQAMEQAVHKAQQASADADQ